MRQLIEPDDRTEASGCIIDALAAQLMELDRVFHRTLQEAAPGTLRHRHEMRLALKAQAQMPHRAQTSLGASARNPSGEKIADFAQTNY